MTSTATILKAMQAVLLVTVLTPATVFAGSLNTHQATQTQIQSQDLPASGEAKHVNRGLILTPAEAATNPPVAPQVEIPPLPPRHDAETAGTTANNYSTAAAPAQTTSTAQNASVVTLPSPAQPASDTTPTPVTNATTAPVAATAPAATPAQTPAAVATPAATTAATSASVTTTPAVTASTRTAQTSHQSRSRHHSDDSFNVGGFNISSSNIERQATKFFNRRDVKSALAQFGF